jgi:cold-inducible RNA-binding protein
MMNDSSPQANPKKIFVGNLAYNLTEADLQNVFSQYGEIVELKLITDRMTGRSKGIAFVTFATEEAAQAAIAGQHDQDISGRAVIVNIARPPMQRDNRGGGGGFGGGRSYDRPRGGYNRDE